MKNNLLVILVTLFLIQPHYSIAQITENSLFWEISGNGLEKPSYLLATVKFMPSDKFNIDKNVEDKLLACEIFAMETLLDHHARHELNKAAHLPHHESVKDYLSDEEFLKLEKLFNEQLGIGKVKFESVYSKFKPVLLSTTITRLTLGKDVVYFEMELVNKANKANLTMQGLETAEREIAAMEKYALEEQVNALVHTIDNFDQQIEDYNDMISAYEAGDLHKVLEYTLHPSEKNEVFKKSFFDDRNMEFVPHMETLMKEGKTFFAIGAGHLADEYGVLNLLVQKGYNLRPLSSN